MPMNVADVNKMGKCELAGGNITLMSVRVPNAKSTNAVRRSRCCEAPVGPSIRAVRRCLTAWENSAVGWSICVAEKTLHQPDSSDPFKPSLLLKEGISVRSKSDIIGEQIVTAGPK